MVWLKRNDNIIGGRDCTDAIMNIVRTSDLEDRWLVIENKHLLSARATGIFLSAQSMPLQASLTLLSCIRFTDEPS